MQSVDVSIDAGDRLTFENEYTAWDRARPRKLGTTAHIGPMTVMHGPTPDGRCNYIGIPEPFLEVLKAKGTVSFRVIT
jgi:hypothetical protein